MVMGRVSVPLYHKGDPMSFEVRKSHSPFFSWEAKFLPIKKSEIHPCKIGQNPKLERLVCKNHVFFQVRLLLVSGRVLHFPSYIKVSPSHFGTNISLRKTFFFVGACFQPPWNRGATMDTECFLKYFSVLP